MRIKIALVILIILGGLVAANLLIDNRSLTRVQLEKVTAVCAGCHGRVPAYQLASAVHNWHAAFSCSRCHGDNPGVRWADTFRSGLGWLGAGAAATALAGVVASLWMTNVKDRVK